MLVLCVLCVEVSVDYSYLPKQIYFTPDAFAKSTEHIAELLKLGRTITVWHPHRMPWRQVHAHDRD